MICGAHGDVDQQQNKKLETENVNRVELEDNSFVLGLASMSLFIFSHIPSIRILEYKFSC